MRTAIVVERAELVERTREDGRHVYRKEGKAALVAACSQPGASVAALALAHGVNANLLRKWITRASVCKRDRPERTSQAPAAQGAVACASDGVRANATQFIAVEVPEHAPAAPARAIAASGTISIQIGSARVEVRGVVEPDTLRLVVDCVRESMAVPMARR